MPGNAAKVVITERQRHVLDVFRRSRTESKIVSQRATIVLLAFEGFTNEQIAAEVGLERHSVGKWRKRWQAGWDSLTLLECTEPHRLRAAIWDSLQDAPRPGGPAKFTAEQVALIIATACEPPENSGLPMTHWTPAELRDEVVRRGIVESISESRVAEILREAHCQPHRRKMWINTKEKDPEVFEQQVEAVCRTYQDAPDLHTQRGVHTLSVDEMTGLQALERIAPDQPMRPGRIERHEFEYARHGTTTLIGNFDVVSGELIAPTIGPTRTEVDFIKHIEQTVALDPDGEWIFIADTLNIHWSAGLVEWVAERCGSQRDREPDGKSGLGKKGARRNLEEPAKPQGLLV
jgi:transposase